MDHGLRSEWQTPAVVPAFDWIRSPRRQFEISLGAALATRTRGSARVRSPTSSWAIDTNGLPAWPNCSPTARQSLALPLHNRDNFWQGDVLRSRVCLPKRNKICLNFTMAAVLHDVPQRKFFRPYRYVSGSAETARIAASVFSSRRCRSRLSHTRLSLRATSSCHRSFCLRRADLFNALGRR